MALGEGMGRRGAVRGRQGTHTGDGGMAREGQGSTPDVPAAPRLRRSALRVLADADHPGRWERGTLLCSFSFSWDPHPTAPAHTIVPSHHPVTPAAARPQLGLSGLMVGCRQSPWHEPCCGSPHHLSPHPSIHPAQPPTSSVAQSVTQQTWFRACLLLGLAGRPAPVSRQLPVQQVPD